MTSDDNGIFPIFDVSGSAAARGKQYGRQAGDLIRVSANIYKNVFEQKGISWEKACDLARYFMPQIEQYNPDLLTEIKAVAEGAELPAEEIVAINARTEIMYGTRRQAKKEAETDIDGCTGAIAKAEITANGHTIHGQNWDWRDECADAAMVLRIRPDVGPDIMTFVEAGILARCGLNSDGIAITGNHLQSDDDFDQRGTPAPMLRRTVLNSRSFAEAMTAVFQAKRAVSNNIMLSHANGECMNFETTPAEVFWMQADDGLLVHSNHFVDETAKAKVKDLGLTTNTDSLYRMERVKNMLAAKRGSLTVEDFKIAFADTYGAPRAVNRAPIQGPGGKTSSTVATIIMDTTAKIMWIAKRPYGSHTYQEYRLND